MEVLGIDIGGTGIKAAPVDVTTGTLVMPRVKVPTPQPAQPEAVAAAVHGLVHGFGWSGPAGITFPGVVTGGVIRTAANLTPGWLGQDGTALFSAATGLSVTVLNDADAAGLAEMRFGAGRGRPGTVLVLTFGTGIGSALFTQGVLVPNTELGHIEIRGRDAEKRASERARELHGLSWEKWADRVGEYLRHLAALVAPDLFIIGGGISRRADKFLPLLGAMTAEVVPAVLHNDAGIVGAAMAGAAGAVRRAATGTGRGSGAEPGTAGTQRTG